MKRRRINLCAALAVLLALSVLTVFTLPTTTAAAARLSLNTASKTLHVGETYRLKLNNAKGVVEWKSDNEKVATVNRKGEVEGLASGKATITAVHNKKSYPCKVTVKHPNRTDDMLDKMIGPVNICYSKELFTETSEEDQKYVWTAKNSSGSDASEIIKLSVFYTAPKTMSYDFIEEQFAREFKEESMQAKLTGQGFTDVKFKRVKKSSYKVPGSKAFRASARISAKRNGEEWQEDRVIYIFSIPDYLIVFSGQASEDGDFGDVDSTIKGILKTMTIL